MNSWRQWRGEMGERAPKSLLAWSDQPFKATQEWPYHLSVGAVVLNERNEILVHYFDEFGYDEAKLTDFHILIRETVEPGESIGAALDRGLSEETGARAELVHYIGQLESKGKSSGLRVDENYGLLCNATNELGSRTAFGR